MGIEGPKISASRMPARRPLRANAKARFTGFTDMSVAFDEKGTDQNGSKGNVVEKVVYHTCDRRLPNSTFRRRDCDHLVDISDLALLRQAAHSPGKLGRCSGARETLSMELE